MVREPRYRFVILNDKDGNLIDIDNPSYVREASFIATGNTTTTPLPADIGEADHIFVGATQEVLQFGTVIVSIHSNVASANKGLVIENSSDGTIWFEGDTYSYVSPGNDKTYSFQTSRKYWRIVYTNGTVAQTSFDLQTQLKPGYVKPSSHRLGDTLSPEDDAELVKANIIGKSTLTGNFENVTTYREVLNVNSAWVHRKIVNETFHQHTGTATTPSIGITAGNISITLTDVTGFIVGGEIKLSENVSGVGIQEIGILRITAVAGNVITLDRPIGNDYTIAAEIELVITNMAVSGTLASPMIFEIDPPLGTVWQFTRILFSLIHATSGDDGKFGGIAALTNGVALRATTAAGRTVVFANWKTNADMKLDMFDVIYNDKAPAGNNGTNGRWTFTKAEIVAELDGDASPIQKLEVLIQDDLTGLISYIKRGQGRVESP